MLAMGRHPPFAKHVPRHFPRRVPSSMPSREQVRARNTFYKLRREIQCPSPSPYHLRTVTTRRRPIDRVIMTLPMQARLDPTLRANPFPEVTDLTCRLPLPTLIHRPEATHLGDLLRIRYGLTRLPNTSCLLSLSTSSFHLEPNGVTTTSRSLSRFRGRTNAMIAYGVSKVRRQPGTTSSSPCREQEYLTGLRSDDA